MDAEALGTSAMLLGAGRATADDVIDPAVGIVLRKKVGDSVRRGEKLAVVHANSKESLGKTRSLVLSALEIGEAAVERAPLVIDEVVE